MVKMKKLLIILGILVVIAIIYSFIDNTPINTTANDPIPAPTITSEITATPIDNMPEPTFIPEWPDMSYEDKVQYFRKYELQYVMESEVEKRPDAPQSQKYYLLIRDNLIQEAKNKYDMAFKQKLHRTGNIKYLMFDFDTGEVMLLYKSNYGRSYGTFKGSVSTDWLIVSDISDINKGTTFRCVDNKLYYVTNEGLNDSEFAKCEIDEPLQYVLKD